MTGESELDVPTVDHARLYPLVEPYAQTYAWRESVLKQEQEFRAEAAGLVIGGRGSAERQILWPEVQRIKLAFAPIQQKPGRFVMSREFKSGEQLHLDNMYWRSFGVFEDRSEAYRRFVTVVVACVAEQAPHAVASAGVPRWSYFGQIAVLIASFALLGWALSLLGPMQLHASLIRAVGPLLGLPVATAWAVKSWPRPLDLHHLPASVLPPGAASASAPVANAAEQA